MAYKIDEDDLSLDAQPDDASSSAGLQKHKSGDILYNREANGVKTEVRISPNVDSHIQVGDKNIMTVNVGYSDRRTKKPQIKKRKKPITTSTEEPTKKQIDWISNNIGKDWRRLGRKLNLSDGQLDNLNMQYKMEGPYEIVYQMLRIWKSESFPVTVQQLAQACDSIGRGDLADDLCTN